MTTLVGIPTRNEAETISSVVQIVDEGLREFFPQDQRIIVNADNSSTDKTGEIFLASHSEAEKRVVYTDNQTGGKGSNLFAIFDAARQVGADRVIVLDGDLRSAEPWWIGQLSTAVECAEAAIAIPTYRRRRYEGNVTNHLASPLVAGAFGRVLRQPIAGAMAFNARFLERIDTWPRPESTELYGIDIYLTAHALREGIRLTEVPLSLAAHKAGLIPKMFFMQQQVLDSLFHAIACLDKPKPLDIIQDRLPIVLEPGGSRPNSPAVPELVGTAARYLEQHQSDVLRLFPTLQGAPECPWGPWLPAETWSQVLADALQGVAAGELIQVRDHLVALYLSRLMTYWQEIQDRSDDEVVELLDRQIDLTIEAVQGRSIEFRPSLAFVPGTWGNAHTEWIQKLAEPA